jgi:hypothetical protein
LKVATANTDVQVTLTREEMAEEDIRVEEKQRLGGVIPNFYVVYDWNAPPLTTKQKYKLAVRTIVDPVNFVIVAGIAGLEQAGNSFPGFGQGASGYAKRVGAGPSCRSCFTRTHATSTRERGRCARGLCMRFQPL